MPNEGRETRRRKATLRGDSSRATGMRGMRVPRLRFLRPSSVGGILTVVAVLAPLVAPATASAHGGRWLDRYDGPVGGPDQANAVAGSPDGHTVFVTGYVDGLGGGGIDDEYATAAYEAASGRRLWIRRYDGADLCTDSAEAIDVSPDGTKVFVTGYSGCL